MSWTTPTVLHALRLPALYRKVCLYAGVPLSPASALQPDGGERFVLRCGAEPPGLFAELLEDAFLEDEAEVIVYGPAELPDFRALAPGAVLLRPGFESGCPVAEDLRGALRLGDGPALVFAVERRDSGGGLLGRTWVAVPEDEPPPQEWFRAAVVREAPAGPG